MDRRDVLIRNIEEKRKILEEQNRKIELHGKGADRFHRYETFT